MCRLLFLLSILLFPLQAESQEGVDDGLVNCLLYRSKKEGVPVYAEPSTSAAVIARLELGENVCYVGEQAGFAIIDWTKQSKIGKSREVSGSEQRLVFVRVVDLWEARDDRSLKQYGAAGILQRLKQYYYYLRSGGIPETGFMPFEPLVEPDPSPTQVPGSKDPN